MLRLRSWTLGFSITAVKTPSVSTLGLNSRCNSGEHITLLDYDRAYEDVVVEELAAIIERDKLSSFMIFKTREIEENGEKVGVGWHACNLDKRPIRLVMNTVYDSSCDAAFKKAPFFYFYRSWVLRLDPKGKRDPPKFVRFVKSPYSEYEQSSAHAKLLKIWHDVPVEEILVRPDFALDAPNLPPIRIVSYKTGKRVVL